jgi:Sec-independent protein translocase protein TatA/GNAT superfamily N-acetyltransferase
VFGISFEELLVLAILAFILFGPQKLPEYAAKLGRIAAKLRAASSDLAQQYQNPFNYPPEPAPPEPTRRRGSPVSLPSPSADSESSCPLCHQTVGQGFIFCPSCGHRLHEEGTQSPYPSIRPLRDDEIDRALEIINQAAQAYKGVIPPDCWQEPYMPEAELRAEIDARVSFWGYEAEGRLLGVMGRQDLHEVVLIRHAYVDPGAQRQGVGARLLTQLLQEIPGPTLVGTWAAAWWAIRFYEKHGFRLVSPQDKDRLLQTYWTISPRQIETSVVLADPTWFAQRDHAAQSAG